MPYSVSGIKEMIPVATPHMPMQRDSGNKPRAITKRQVQSDTVSQIAYRVGFSSLPYFNKCFKEEFGMTPGRYAAVDEEVK